MYQPTHKQIVNMLEAILDHKYLSKDRYIKGHAKDLLTRLQALNPQDND